MIKWFKKLYEKEEIPQEWDTILEENVLFYQKLDTAEKKRFQEEVYDFLEDIEITGVEVEVSDIDRLFVASSATIPIFNFSEWRYKNLKQVILLREHFNHSLETEGKERRLLGMVYKSPFIKKMILSQKSLHHGFSNKTDKLNVGIHEFVHLIDKADGKIDGIPEILLENHEIIPWIKLMQNTIKKIERNKTKINKYGATNEAEFFSVISEYFFERPKLLKRKHPELYEMLENIFT